MSLNRIIGIFFLVCDVIFITSKGKTTFSSWGDVFIIIVVAIAGVYFLVKG